jgi:hypothetical protein
MQNLHIAWRACLCEQALEAVNTWSPLLYYRQQHSSLTSAMLLLFVRHIFDFTFPLLNRILNCLTLSLQVKAASVIFTRWIFFKQ